MLIMWTVVRIPAGNTTNDQYNFVVAKPLVANKLLNGFSSNFLEVFLNICHYAPASSITSHFPLYVPTTPLTIFLSGHLLNDGMTSNLQELLFKVPIFACFSVVCLSVSQNTWTNISSYTTGWFYFKFSGTTS